MTVLVRARGIVLSLAAHVLAGALLLTLSAPEWTRPLFVDLVQHAESLEGHPGAPGDPSGQAGARHDATAAASGRPEHPASARWGHLRLPTRQSGTPTPTMPSGARPPAQVKPDASHEARPDPRPIPPAAPTPLPERSPRVEPRTASPPPPPSAVPAPPEPSVATAPAPAPEPSRNGPLAGTGPRVPAGPPVETGARSSAEPGRGATASGSPRGQGEIRGDAGSSAGGSPGAVLALGTGGGIPPEYGPYLQRFRRHVQESVVYPLAARRQSLRGTVELDITLDPSGRVRDARIARSSSHGVLDDAALDAVRSLEPLPLPEWLPRRPLLIRLPLVFELQ